MVWEQIPNFEGYAVNEEGQVQNMITRYLLSQSVNQYGVVMVFLRKNGQQYTRGVAKLVATAFLEPHPQPAFDTPIHLDGDRTNSHVRNLAWRPRWFAISYHRQFAQRPPDSDGIPVINTTTGEEFDSHWEVAMKYGALPAEVLLAAHNRTYVFPVYQEFRLLE